MYFKMLIGTSLLRSSTTLRTATFLLLTTMATSLDKYMPCDPSFSVVPPGGCQFDEEWTTCKVTKKQQCSFDTQVITFDLPCKTKPLNLPTCACILAMGGKGNDDDKPFIRPYTPVSTNSMVGDFEVMVKSMKRAICRASWVG